MTSSDAPRVAATRSGAFRADNPAYAPKIAAGSSAPSEDGEPCTRETVTSWRRGVHRTAARTAAGAACLRTRLRHRRAVEPRIDRPAQHTALTRLRIDARAVGQTTGPTDLQRTECERPARSAVAMIEFARTAAVRRRRVNTHAVNATARAGRLDTRFRHRRAIESRIDRPAQRITLTRLRIDACTVGQTTRPTDL